MTPLPSTDALRQMTSEEWASPTSSSSHSWLTTIGRSCKTWKSLVSAARAAIEAANSISTGEFIPRRPNLRIRLRTSGSGNLSYLRIGANVTTRGPSRATPSYTVSFSGEYVEPTFAMVPSASATDSCWRTSLNSRLASTLSRGSGNSRQRKLRCELRSISSTVENCTTLCG